MKVSIAWIFDHIDADWRSIDIEALVKKFNETTAEIEDWYAVTVDTKNLFIGTVDDKGSCFIPELKKKVLLPSRDDARLGESYLVKQEGNSFVWATSIDLGAHKQMALPAVKNQAWKKSLEAHDYILDIDNKSITHRPDLWGARGFAREIAALLNYKLKPLDSFIVKHPVKTYEHAAPASKGGPSIAIQDKKHCDRFAGLYIPHVAHSPSLLWMVARLSRVDVRAIDALIDFTNYVMLDTSQPMHVFDAEKIDDTLQVRQAKNNEKLELLDGQTVELCKKDIVIADAKKALSLAGIMGGRSSGVSAQTTSVFLESAHFDAATIRLTSQRYHVRSESSARFEKNVDPMQNVTALLRFLKLMDDAKIAYADAGTIASVGKTVKAPTVLVSHAFIEKRIGVALQSSFIKKTLEKIGFSVTQKKKKADVDYSIIVPLYRATKDVLLPEDVVEEVARFYGYSQIPFVLPEKRTLPTGTKHIRQVAAIKHELAFGLSMRELYSYSFFDESFLRTFGWEPGKTVNVKDPVSENWYRLVTTLMPQMLKAVHDNAIHNDELRFFEWGRVWHDQSPPVEQKKLAGIFYYKRTALDFYDIKAQLDHLFAMIKLPVQWRSCAPRFAWMNESQTAQLIHAGKSIGLAGTVDSLFFKSIAEGTAFIFELDADYLEAYEAPVHRFVPLPKYPAVERDISVLVPLDCTVAQLSALIANASNAIVSVALIDFFTKKEWGDQKALTFRYVMRGNSATLTGAQADDISKKVDFVLTQAGATIR